MVNVLILKVKKVAIRGIRTQPRFIFSVVGCRVAHSTEGCIHPVYPDPADSAYLGAIVSQVKAAPGVLDVRVNPQGHTTCYCNRRNACNWAG